MEPRTAPTPRPDIASPHRDLDVVYPLRWERGRPVPFPTIYWLRPGPLHRAVADLERRGLIADLEHRIAFDEVFHAAVHADHRRYIAQRWAMLTRADRGAVRQWGLEEHFRGRGIAGIADFNHVKCLHAHVAHALAERNTLGQIVLNACRRVTP